MKETIGKGRIFAGLLVLAAAVYSGWQVGACEIANIQLQDDLQDTLKDWDTRLASRANGKRANLLESLSVDSKPAKRSNNSIKRKRRSE